MHLVRQRDVLDVGELLEHDLARAPLVLGVHEREQVHDRDRAHAELLQPLHAAAHGVLVERQEHLALEVHALADRDARPPPGDRDRARVVRVPDLFLVAAPQLDLVAVAFGDEQARSPRRSSRSSCCRRWSCRARGCRARAQNSASARPKRSASWPSPFITPRDWSSSVRRRLVEHDLAVGRDADQVGERAPDVDPDPVAHRLSGAIAARSARSCSVAVVVDRERQVFERAGEHDAVVAARAFDRHVLVEHVVEHGLRVAVERDRPSRRRRRSRT